MEVPVYDGDAVCGTLRARERGLYTVFEGEVAHEGVARLYGMFQEGEMALGIPVPEAGRLRLRTSAPTRCLPGGTLIRGELRETERAWRRYDGGRAGEARLPAGLVLGDRYRFPWRPGDRLPCDELLCFFRYVEGGGSFLELRVDDRGRPVV